MKTKFKMLIAAATIAASGFAHAVPATEFFYSQNAGWLNPITDGDGATYVNPTAFASPYPFTLSMGNPTGPLAPDNTFGEMRWTDTGGAYSAIHVNTYNNANSFSSGNMLLGDTDGNGQWNAGEYWAISTLTQENHVITGNFPNPLWVANVSANLRIFGDAGHTIGAFSDLAHNTLIRFWETLNTQELGLCTSPAPMGSRCDDIYSITLSSLDSQLFQYDGNWYQLSYTLLPGNDVLVCTSATDPGCNAASAPADGQIAVYTREGEDSTIHVAMAWQQVPEPSMLSLMGLALVGLGFASRRRRTM